jgi:recombination protein RecA
MSSLSKFRKRLNTADTFNVGFSEIPEWICTGNYALNYILSGSLTRGIPVARSTMISGLSGTGKSFLVSNIAKNAQAMGYSVIYIDTENSVGEGFMVKIGVDLSEEAFLPVSLYSIEDAFEFFSQLLKDTEKTDKILLVVDSLSNLEPAKDMEKNDDGKVAYGQGLKEKLYKSLVRAINCRVGNRNMAALFVAHEYVAGSDTYGNPILKPSVGQGTMFLPSLGLTLTKADLREGKVQVGVSVRCKTYKTRYTSLGKKCEFDLPWDRGLSITDGLCPVLEAEGIINKSGAWYSYVLGGETKKFQASSIDKHADALIAAYVEKMGEVITELPEEDANIDMVEEG